MISRFFIDRPIFANVLAIVTMLIGAVTVFVLPIEQYPQITPPTVQVTTTFPGADAKVLSDTVASPIEQEVNGVEGMLYMSSTCAADGSYNLTVTFNVGTNLDMAQVLVQNRVAIAQPKLPQEVQRQGITTKKKSTAIILVVALTSKSGADLELLPALKKASDLPAEGKDLIVVADVDHALNFRIFDTDGKKVVDTDEKQLPAESSRIEALRKRLETQWPPHELTSLDKSAITADVASIVGHVPKVPPQFDSLYLSNYATLQVKDILSRIYGVGDIQIFGASNYGMRIWLDPEKLKARNLTTLDVLNAIQEQNIQVAAGQIGAPPAPTDQSFQYTVTTKGRLKDPEEFGNIIIKTSPGDDSGTGARLTRVKDVARVELGGQVYDQWCDVSGKAAAGVAVFQLPGANALDVADKVVKAMDQLKKTFPEGMEYSTPYDTTIFVRESIHEVYKTLFEAGILVLIVILVFLQDWRATLVPATTVPVTIIGAFAAMYALGFTVNLLTLFGLILAIGIVVDDAIVIVENAAHHIDHDKVSAKEATIRAMDEVTGPVIGITLVLMAVFLPTAFLGGITGQLYRQFALTIAATAVISAINAVTLKPAQCATYLRPTPARKNAFYRGFNFVYDKVENVYVRIVALLIRHTAPMMLLFFLMTGATLYWFTRLPTGFLPVEDQGYAIVGIQLPDASSQSRTRQVVRQVEEIFKKTPGVGNWVMIGGQSVLDQTVASNAATFYVRWTGYEERKTPETQQDAIINHLRGEFAKIQEAIVFAFPPPAIMGLGVAGGFQIQVEDRGNTGLTELQMVTDEMVRDGNAQSGLKSLNTTFRATVPQLYADIDRVKAKSLDVPLDYVFGTLQSSMGSAYVNDFNLLGRTFQVRVQADQKFRLQPDDIRRLEVRNRAGAMLPLGTLAKINESLGPQIITRYNLYPSSSISGEASAGSSSGQALQLMEQMAADKLPGSMSYEWTGMSYQEKQVGGQSVYIFGLAVLLVYLVLAAQYESWLIPAAVIMVVPLALLGTVAAVSFRGMDNNIYTQIGIVLIIALASKNAILIVEFARELRAKGESIMEAAVHSARLRFRPILMTSFAFILGIFPLVNAEGAGAASRRALGTAVFGGMLAATFLAVFFVPVFYVVIQRFIEFRRKPKGAEANQSVETVKPERVEEIPVFATPRSIEPA